jgi:hypothetical protein
MSNTSQLRGKVTRKIKTIVLKMIVNTPFQFYLYKSYWNYRRSKSTTKYAAAVNNDCYIAQKPNYGAGIGHQLANWNAGYHYAQYYGTQFAHFPFSSDEWEAFLGLGEHELQARDLINDRKIKKVRLPLFDDTKQSHLDMIGHIIQSYRNVKAFFILEQDQGYNKQYETYKALSEKFFNAAARKDDKLMYAPGCFNVAIHIRRGDIVAMKKDGLSNWKDRWLDNSYYVNVLNKLLQLLKLDKPVKVYLFSQGTKDDFPEFAGFTDIVYCLETDVFDSFLHLATADLLVSSKSSFSYKPALISKGLKISPANFWHEYPDEDTFILANDNGDFDSEQLLRKLPNGSNIK